MTIVKHDNLAYFGISWWWFIIKIQNSEWFFYLFLNCFLWIDFFISLRYDDLNHPLYPRFFKEFYNALHNHLPHNFINFNQTLFTQSSNDTSSRICSEAFRVHCSHRLASLHLSELMHTLTHPGDYWQQHCQTGCDLVWGNFCLSFP